MSFGDLLQNDNRKKMTRRPHARHFNSSPAPTSRAHGQASEAGHAPQAATMSETAHTTQAADQYALHESEAGVLHDQFVHSHQMNFNDMSDTVQMEPQTEARETEQSRFGSFDDTTVSAPIPALKQAHTRSFADSDRGVINDVWVPEAKRAYHGWQKTPVSRKRFILGAAALAAVGAGIFTWATRKVDVFVNDTKMSVKAGTNLDDIYKQAGISTQNGNYVAVDGSILEEGKGSPYSVNIDDKPLDEKDFAAWMCQGGEHINFGDGKDRMEDYDVEVQETKPKLAVSGEPYGAIRYVEQWGKVGKQEIRTGKVSGITAPGDVLQEVQDCLIRTHNVVPDNGQKLVSVTFDDGPSIYTDRYLQILKERGITTTFFNIGQNVDNLTDLPKKVLDAGHYVAGHSYTHPLLSKKKPEELREELGRTKESIARATGVTTSMFRPPYGDFTMKTWLYSQGIVSSEILWNQDTLDWKQPGVDKIIQGALHKIVPGSIVLMHDGGGKRDQDVEALPTILDKLIADGYKIVSIQELLKSDSSIPDDIADGTATMPEDCVWPEELA